MTIQTLFGQEVQPSKPRSIRFRQIKAVYEAMTVREEVTSYLKPGTRFSAPQQVYETFSFLMRELLADA